MKKKLIIIAVVIIVISIITVKVNYFRGRPKYFSLNSITNIELNFQGDSKDLKEGAYKKKVIEFLNSIEYKPIKMELRPTGGYTNYVRLKNKNGDIQHIAFYDDKVNYCLIKDDTVIEEKWYETDSTYLDKLENLFKYADKN